MFSCDTDKSVESLDELSDKPDKQGTLLINNYEAFYASNKIGVYTYDHPDIHLKLCPNSGLVLII